MLLLFSNTHQGEERKQKGACEGVLDRATPRRVSQYSADESGVWLGSASQLPSGASPAPRVRLCPFWRELTEWHLIPDDRGQLGSARVAWPVSGWGWGRGSATAGACPWRIPEPHGFLEPMPFCCPREGGLCPDECCQHPQSQHWLETQGRWYLMT